MASRESHGPQFRLPTTAIAVTLRIRIVTSQGGADMRYLFRNVKRGLVSITEESTS